MSWEHICSALFSVWEQWSDDKKVVYLRRQSLIFIHNNIELKGTQGILFKGEHECTRGWPRSVPTGLQTFKIQTQIRVSIKVQVTRIHGSSTHEHTSTCYLIKQSDTSRIWTSSLLHLKTVVDHWAICT